MSELYIYIYIYIYIYPIAVSDSAPSLILKWIQSLHQQSGSPS